MITGILSFLFFKGEILSLLGADYIMIVFCNIVAIQSSMPPGISLRSMTSAGPVSSMGSYEQQFVQQYQAQNQPQFRLQQMPSLSQTLRDQGVKSMQSPQAAPDPFGLLGLLSVIRMSDPDLTSLALGIDLTTLGLNLNSSENLHKTFASPWSDEPAKGGPDFSIPECYYAKQPPPLHVSYLTSLLFSYLLGFHIQYSYCSPGGCSKVILPSSSCLHCSTFFTGKSSDSGPFCVQLIWLNLVDWFLT